MKKSLIIEKICDGETEDRFFETIRKLSKIKDISDNTPKGTILFKTGIDYIVEVYINKAAELAKRGTLGEKELSRLLKYYTTIKDSLKEYPYDI